MMKRKLEQNNNKAKDEIVNDEKTTKQKADLTLLGPGGHAEHHPWSVLRYCF